MRFSFLRMASVMAVTVLLGVGCTDDEKKDLDEGQKSSNESTATPPEGVEAVDLGLSVKWASFNVGATKPEEYGDYYAWGETETKSIYNWSTYKWCNGSDTTMTKYCNNSERGNEGFTDTLTVLTPEDDIAHVKWGGNWRMPTKAEQDDLRTKCTWTWYSGGNTKATHAASGSPESALIIWDTSYCGNDSKCTELFGVSVSETMAARGLVNGRSLCSRRYHGRWEVLTPFRMPYWT